MPARSKVAIACQGGGSHAAFAAGVLKGLLSPSLRDRYDLVGLSGTSGGAMCAALAWSGLLQGGPEQAIARLDAFWNAVKACSLPDVLANAWGVSAARAPVTSELGPYLYQPVAERQLLALIHDHVALHEITPAQRAASPVSLLVGATDVMSGERVVFGGDSVTARHLLASAAIPPLYAAVQIGERHYWDGLFTSNPPVREFTDEAMTPRKPDEIWIVQINPQRQDDVPRAMGDVVDRRNELAGNLALAQELYFIDKINALTREMKARDAGWRYRHIALRIVQMPLPGLDYASKLDRHPQHIDRLVQAGEQEAARFFSEPEWPGCGSIPKGNRCIP